MEAEFEAAWPSLSTVERQHALTALAQAKQFEVLLSAHVVQPEDALDHKHNSLVASTAQSVLTNSLKVDENSFKRNERKNYYAEIKAAMDEYKARQAKEPGEP
jgi:hemerythrin-like domain-containing protein